MKRLATFLATIVVALTLVSATQADTKIKVLIVDGQNNHKDWPKTTPMMKSYLEQTGRFAVDVATTGNAKAGTKDFAPNFSDYDVVLSNYNGQPWPDSTNEAFEKFVKEGGGFVVVHAADNAFSKWDSYNRMIGLGGWGGRNADSGPYVYFDEAGKLVRDPSPGRGGHHGRQHPFQIIVRDEHPITDGMPKAWMHEEDELYDSLRGPAENMTVLATAYADPKTGGSGRHEPMMMVLEYGKGRVFHTPMGHDVKSMECVGFISTLQRGSEWAATGEVTLPIPDGFPTEDKVSTKAFKFDE